MLFAITIVVCVESQLITETSYNAIVSKDGTGNFNTIAGAILAAPDHSVKPFFIKIKKGTYEEYIRVEKKKINIVLIGEGMDNTIITGNRSFVDGNKTYDTATVGKSLSLYKCRFDGYQDTLYAKRRRQFYRDCEIYGTVDFICGDAIAVFQNCLIEARTPMARQYNTIIAQQRELESYESGIVLQNCTIKATPDLKKSNVTTYLGRPWGTFSRTVIMESYIDDLIDPRGWVEWIESANKSSIIRRPYYLEYKNRGPGAVTKGRVTWASVVS
uniref:Pectinesterase n=1 Tax=Solanum lycopersicum TaxID=4081 RepID=A0A3Q7EGB2_SOLLC